MRKTCFSLSTLAHRVVDRLRFDARSWPSGFSSTTRVVRAVQAGGGELLADLR